MDRKFTVKGRKREVTVHLKTDYTLSRNKSEGSPVEKTATCSCSKPQLLHKPCSHVIAICCKIGVSSATYMSPYYSLPYLCRTLSGIFDEYKISRSYRNITPFECNTTTWIPDKRLECGLPVFVTSDCLMQHWKWINWRKSRSDNMLRRTWWYLKLCYHLSGDSYSCSAW